MSKANITTHVRRVNGVSIIDINGEVNAQAEDALAAAYAEASQGGVKAVVLNFGGMDEHYQQIFALTRLNEAISIYGSEAEAVAAVA
jgi:anti-anti-sigma regulatory factor